MQCPKCKFDNPAEATTCQGCRAGLARGDESPTITELPGADWSRPLSTGVMRQATSSLDELTPGSELAGRYEILKLLGEGGMGAVYKARDREVDRVVAVKVIRPELANQPAILGRFKQELILARQITHKNVIRIFDLGQADGIKFITMEFVEGRDLHSLIKEGNDFTLERKVKIIQQVCRALDAAHAERVVHRDLKPHNIMEEASTGRVVVMDFGIARSMEQTGVTSTGTLIGTPAYMSPEQARGEHVDTRSDLFSLGVIFYELLIGRVPYESETMVGMLLKRIQERPVPPIDRDPTIPQAISDVVLGCLTVDVEQRYQTAREVWEDLEAWQGSPGTFTVVGRTMAIPRPPASQSLTLTMAAGTMASATLAAAQAAAPGPPARGRKPWKWIAAAASVTLLAGAGFLLRDRFVSAPAGPHAPVTVMIADFSNHTGDQLFDGTLEPMVKIALEGAGFISAYDRTRVRDLGLPAVNGKLDEQAARQIAISQGLSIVLAGSFERQGSGYGISLTATQAVTGQPIQTSAGEATNKDQVLFAVTKVASEIRKALGDSSSDSEQRFAMETLSATSLEAVHEYAVAMEALSNGRSDEAMRGFSKAADLDANFGLAYTGMATAARNLRLQEDAEKYIKLAFTHMDRMTEREKYRTRGSYYALTGDMQECVKEYGDLISRYSSDVAAHNNLGTCHSRLRNLPKAIEEMQRAIEILPKRAVYQFNLAMYHVYAGDFQTAEKEIQSLLEDNPTYEKGYLTLAYVQIEKGQLGEAAATYRALEKLSASGASLAASGLADLAVYEGRFGEAVRILESGAAADLSAKRTDAAADKFAALASIQLLRGQKAAALKAADNVLANSRGAKSRFLSGFVLAGLGETARARTLSSELASAVQVESKAYGKLIDGEIALQAGDANQAIQAFTESNNLLDSWLAHFQLGRAYLEAKAFPQADSEFDRSLKRRGEATEVFMDSVPTYGYLPPVYYYLGRVREEQKSSGFAESYKKYLSIREKADEDPRLAEVRRRAGL